MSLSRLCIITKHFTTHHHHLLLVIKENFMEIYCFKSFICRFTILRCVPVCGLWHPNSTVTLIYIGIYLYDVYGVQPFRHAYIFISKPQNMSLTLTVIYPNFGIIWSMALEDLTLCVFSIYRMLFDWLTSGRIRAILCIKLFVCTKQWLLLCVWIADSHFPWCNSLHMLAHRRTISVFRRYDDYSSIVFCFEYNCIHMRLCISTGVLA